MSGSNRCFLKVVLYSHLFQNFPQFVVIHTVKGFGIVNKTEVEVNMKMGKNLKEDKLDGNVWDVNELG